MNIHQNNGIAHIHFIIPKCIMYWAKMQVICGNVFCYGDTCIMGCDVFMWYFTGILQGVSMVPTQSYTLQIHHNECDDVSNQRRPDCLFRRRPEAQTREDIKAPRHWLLWEESTRGQFTNGSEAFDQDHLKIHVTFKWKISLTRSQFCSCAKFTSGSVIRIQSRAKRCLTRFQPWTHKLLWDGF